MYRTPAVAVGRRSCRHGAHRHRRKSVYRRCADDDHHHHLVCRGCGIGRRGPAAAKSRPGRPKSLRRMGFPGESHHRTVRHLRGLPPRAARTEIDEGIARRPARGARRRRRRPAPSAPGCAGPPSPSPSPGRVAQHHITPLGGLLDQRHRAPAWWWPPPRHRLRRSALTGGSHAKTCVSEIISMSSAIDTVRSDATVPSWRTVSAPSASTSTGITSARISASRATVHGYARPNRRLRLTYSRRPPTGRGGRSPARACPGTFGVAACHSMKLLACCSPRGADEQIDVGDVGAAGARDRSFVHPLGSIRPGPSRAIWRAASAISRAHRS